MQIKRIEFLDIIKDESSKQADDADELFELDFTLMTGELSKMLADLTAALGGEVNQ
jgi:recombination associated protein RdgC